MKDNKALLLILLLSFILRLINLNQSLWFDEAINVVYARSNDFIWFITKYPIGDFHPSGWFAILWVWGNIFGWSEIAVRIPSVIFGVFSVLFTYLISKELFSKKIGLLSALMLCFAPLSIYYSQETRMYSLSAFAVTFSFYSFILFINKKKYSWLVFLISMIFVFYSDYVAYFIFPIQFIYLMIYYKTLLKNYLLITIGALVFYIPWLFVLPQQLLNGQQTAMIIPGWREVVGGSSVRELFLLGIKTLTGRVSFDNNIYSSFLIILLGMPFLISLIKIKEIVNKNSLLIIYWLIITTISVWLFSFFIPIFSYFRLIFILPAFYIIIALCLTKFSKKLSNAILVLIIISEIIASGLYLFIDNYQRENWKSASQISLGQGDSAVIFEDDNILAPYLYYNPNHLNTFPGLIKKPAESIDDISSFKVPIKKYKKIYLFDYLVEINDPLRLVEKKLINLGYKKVQQFDYRGVGFVTLYEIF